MCADRLPVVLTALALAGCAKDRPPTPSEPATFPASSASAASCGHAACGADYVVDATQVGECDAGGTCRAALTLVASGAYHINDEYPYKFRADDDPNVDFLGSDSGGKTVFSKAARDWAKPDEKTGTMTVSFKPRDGSVKALSGVFKLSVCSLQNCRLEQAQIRVPLAVR